MVNKNLFFTATIVAAIVIILLFFLYESQEDKVKKVFYHISDCVEKKANENPIVGAGKAKQIREAFMDSCVVQMPSRSISRAVSSQEISSHAYAQRTHFKTVSLDFYDIKIEFLDKTSVLATLTAVFKGALTTGELSEDVHELICTLEKVDDNWRIRKIEVIDILEK